jgi:hypothetical protein
VSSSDIRREVDAALREVARDTGTGEPLIVTFALPQATPVNPWDAPNANPPQTIQVVAYERSISLSLLDTTLIEAGDKMWLVSALDVNGAVYGEPQTSWKATALGVQYAIMMVKATAPAGEGLMYLVQGRA